MIDFKRKKRIYLDFAASTPIDGRVSFVMKKAESGLWPNSSSLYTEGMIVKSKMNDARISIARILHSKAEEIYFTSGGTESLSIVIHGVVRRALEKGIVPHIVTSTIEHSAVLKNINNLINERNTEIEVSFVFPNKDGIVNPSSIEKEIKENTVLVVLMHSNNEIGTIQPVSQVSSLLKKIRNKKNEIGIFESYPYLLVDACQSVCYEDVSIERLGADILVLDGIKMYGPRGVGILAVKNYVKISPLSFGGGQENGLRPGTENVIGIVGIREALEIAVKMRESEKKRLIKIRDYAIQSILKEFKGSSLNGSIDNRIANNINICFPGLNSEFAVIKLDTLGFAVSSSSACNNLSEENYSHVIEAIGKNDCKESSLRFTLGRDTTKSDLNFLIKALKKIIK